MTTETFQILVNGTLMEGAKTEQVKQNIAELFKTTLDKVEPMFSGRKLTVKKGLDRQTALKYKAAINKAGLAAAVAPMTRETPAHTDNANGISLNHASLATVGSTLDVSPVTASADIDTSNLVMDSVGETLSEATITTEPVINISQISMGGAGEDVSEYTPIPEPDIDISNLAMGEAGEAVMRYESAPEANINISELSIAAVGEDVMQHKTVPPADIDTSNLALDSTTDQP